MVAVWSQRNALSVSFTHLHLDNHILVYRYIHTQWSGVETGAMTDFRAINGFSRPCCGRQGATMLLGNNDTYSTSLH